MVQTALSKLTASDCNWVMCYVEVIQYKAHEWASRGEMMGAQLTIDAPIVAFAQGTQGVMRLGDSAWMLQPAWRR